MKASADMPRRRERALYHQESAFERGRMVGLREAGLTSRDIGSYRARCCDSYACMESVEREEGRTQRQAGTGPRNETTAWDDHNLIGMAVTDRTASSTVLSGRWSTATVLDLSASTVRRRLLSSGLEARMPLRRLPLSRYHLHLRLQWARERRHCRAEWQNVVFSDESCFNMSYNDGRIRVRRYAGERNLRVCILQRHRGPTPSVKVWGAMDTICDLASYVLRAI